MKQKKGGLIQLTLWDLMEKDNILDMDAEVPIEGVINLKSKPISDYKVRLAYGDLTLIIAVLRDYVKGLDELLEMGELKINDIQYEAYYRKKFIEIANKISEQIEYDYDKKREACIKKLSKEDKSDVGDEALSLALKRSTKQAEAAAKAKEEAEKAAS